MNALRRIRAVAGATLRDLFLGQGVAAVLGLLLLAGLWLARTDAVDGVERQALELKRRLGAFAGIAGLAAALVAATSVHQDRESRRAAQLLATPLRGHEYLLAKVAAAALGIGICALPVQGLLVGCALAGEAGERLRPRATLAAGVVALVEPSGARNLWNHGSLLLEPGARLELEYPEALATFGEEPWTWWLRARALADGERLRLEVRFGAGVPVATNVASVGEIELPLGLPASAPPQRIVVVAPDDGAAAVIHPRDLLLRGPAGGCALPIVRAVVGVAVLLVLAAALGAGLAALLPDLIAVAGAVTVGAFGFLRSLLLEAARTIAHADAHGEVEAPSRVAAALIEPVLRAAPDLAATVAVDRIARGRLPFVPSDFVDLALPIAMAAAALVAGALWLERVRWRRRR